MWENNDYPLFFCSKSLALELSPHDECLWRRQEEALNRQWLTALKMFGFLYQTQEFKRGMWSWVVCTAGQELQQRLKATVHPVFSTAPCVSVLSSSCDFLFWSRSGSVPERCSSQHRTHYDAERTQRPLKRTNTMHVMSSLQCNQCLWPLVAHQVWMERSPLQLMVVLQGRLKTDALWWGWGWDEEMVPYAWFLLKTRSRALLTQGDSLNCNCTAAAANREWCKDVLSRRSFYPKPHYAKYGKIEL